MNEAPLLVLLVFLFGPRETLWPISSSRLRFSASAMACIVNIEGAFMAPPVSYTHLDVYKRQMIAWPVRLPVLLISSRL